MKLELFCQIGAAGGVDRPHQQIVHLDRCADIQRQGRQLAPGEHFVQMVAQLVLNLWRQQRKMVSYVFKASADFKNYSNVLGTDAGTQAKLVTCATHHKQCTSAQ